jgi:hypothetical protein
MEHAQHTAALLRQRRFDKSHQGEHDSYKQHAAAPGACAQYAHRASRARSGRDAERLSLAASFIHAHPITVAITNIR